jgi:membrane protease subunit (stomatin/prohibitin family)
MKIDKNPVLDEINRTITVQDNISNAEISISINGLMAIHVDDIESVSNNIITVVPGLDIDWENDTFVVFYE